MEDMIRIGIVSSIDKKTGMASIYFPGSDGEVTEMLPYANFGGQYKPPAIGSNVIVADLSDGGAVVLGPYWDVDNPGGQGDRVFHRRLDEKAYIDYDGETLTIAAGKVNVVSLDG